MDNGVVTFFHSCGMSPKRKGCDLVLRSFAKLHGKAKLVIHSQQRLKQSLPELTDLISLLENTGSLIIYEGSIGAPGLYYKGDIYVYPSRLEGIGLTVAEALACGLPIITSDNPPMNEFVFNGINGRLAGIDRHVSRNDGYYWPQCDVNEKELCDGMQWYVDRINDIPRFKRDARKYAEEKLDWKKSYPSINAIFSKIPKQPIAKHQDLANQVNHFEQNRRIIKFSKLMLPFWWLKNMLNFVKRIKC